MNSSSRGALRDDDFQRVSCTMCRTNNVLDEVSSVQDVLKTCCRRRRLVIKMNVDVADEHNRRQVDGQTLDEFGEIFEKDRCGRFRTWPLHDD